MGKSKKLNERLSTAISTAAIIISVVSLSVSVRQCSLEERRMKLHLEPNLVCVLDDHPRKKGFLLFTIKNEGPVEAINVAVDHLDLRYDKAEKKILVGLWGSDNVLEYSPPGKRWIFAPQLTPNARIHKLAGDAVLRDSTAAIDVLLFDIAYYREADGQRYEKRIIYYADGKNIYTAAQFRTHPEHDNVISQTSNFLSKVKFTSPEIQKRQ